MKIKIFQPLVIVDILSAILLLVILLVPASFFRLVLALPFIIFFPGYTLLAALFSNWRDKDSLEILALSVIASIAIVGLIGLGLNLTVWGIAEVPVICSIAVFILVTSIIGLIRQARVTRQVGLIQQINSLQVFRSLIEFNINLPATRLKIFSKSLTSLLLVAVIIATGVLGYTVFASKDREKYSEFYILGLNGKAHEYPLEFVMQDHRVIQVNYDLGINSTPGEWGEVTIGIVSHQQQKVSYSLKININGEAADVNYSGIVVPEIKSIELSPGDKWEGMIGFAPRKTGDNQKVEFLFFQDNGAVPEDILQLWIKTSGE